MPRLTAPTTTTPTTTAGDTSYPRNIKAEALSMVAIFGIMLYVKVVTGQGMLTIVMESLPSLGLD